MFGKSLQALYFLFVIPFICTVSTAELSLAIIPEDTTASSAADILTVELSKSPVLVLLERAALDKIIAEQSLSLARPGDLLNAGELAGADTLLLLDSYNKPAPPGEKPVQVLGLRLISVRHGILLHTFEFTWPISDLPGWSARLSAQLQPHFARVQLPSDKVVKFSLLNFKSPTESRQSRLLDNEINALLLKRLSAETNLFVLERQKLSATFFERALNSESSPFWGGSYLVEGSINNLGFSTNQVTLEGRIRAPGDSSPKVVQLTCKPSEVPALVDAFAMELLKLASQTSTAHFEPGREAARYFDEAVWSLRWGVLPAAQSAADAAWALGKRDDATAILRVLAYSRAADSERGVSMRFPQRRRLKFQNWPQPSALHNSLSALSIYWDYSRSLPPAPAVKPEAWIDAGNEALIAASKLLYHYYFTPEARLSVQSSLLELRSLCRDVSAWLLQLAQVRAPFFLDSPGAFSLDQVHSALEREHPIKTIAQYGALWDETPQDSLNRHRSFLTAPSFPVIRKIYFAQDHEHIPLAGWSWNVRKTLHPLWSSFLEEIASHTNLVTSIEAKFLQAASFLPDPALYAHIQALADLIATNATFLALHPAPLNYEYDLPNLIELGSGTASPERETLERKLSSTYRPLLERIRPAQFKHQDTRAATAAAQAAFPAQKDFLESRNVDMPTFVRLFRPGPISADDASKLLPLLKSYLSHLSNVVATAAPAERGPAQAALFFAAKLESRLNSSLGVDSPPAHIAGRPAVPPATNLAPNAPPPRPGQNFPGGSRSFPGRPGFPPRPGMPSGLPAFTPAPLLSNSLRLATFRPFPTNRLSLRPLTRPNVNGVKLHHDSLWVHLAYTEQLQDFNRPIPHRACIFQLDLNLQPSSLIDLPADRFTIQLPGFSNKKPDFQPWRNAVFVPGARELQRFDISSRSWTALPVPLPSFSQLYLVQDKLYALTPDSLLEISYSGTSVQTLASTRRQPPLNPLDSLPDLSRIVISPSGRGPVMSAGTNLYEIAADSISPLMQFPREGQAYSAGDSLVFFENHRFEREVVHLLSPQTLSTTPLFLQLPHHASPRFYIGPQTSAKHPETIWKGLDQFIIDPGTVLLLPGGDLLAFATPAVTMHTSPNLPVRHGVELKEYLVYFPKDHSLPVLFGLDSPTDVPSCFQRDHFGRPPALTLLVSKDSLFISNPSVLGLWMFPLSELKKGAAAAAELPGTPSQGQVSESKLPPQNSPRPSR